MPRKVAWRQALIDTGTPPLREVSQAYAVGSCNTVRVVVVVLSLNGQGTVAIEGSLDKACWEVVTTTRVGITSLGKKVTKLAGITWRFVRLQYATTFSPYRAVLSASISGTML
ncbi:MAG: hypothetical protein HUU15_13635 [Candidatus Brocadiae bacterium]|nr:hypothetical protein [Candidatus Brocadiia bacterium]